MAKIINSYRFLDGITGRMMKHWATLGPPRQIPWSPLVKPMSQCTVSIVSLAALPSRPTSRSTKTLSGGILGPLIHRIEFLLEAQQQAMFAYTTCISTHPSLNRTSTA